MRATTPIHIAIRNIGDSQDLGSFHYGPLSDSILWLATKLSGLSIATRIVIGIGRSKDDAAKGIDVSGAGKSALHDDMKAMLESVFADAGEPADGASPDRVMDVAAKQAEDDDYVA